MKVICRSFTIDEFKNYVTNIKFDGWTPKFIVVHNTSVPNQKLYRQWHTKPGWNMEQWGKNLASYYIGQGWNGCPHLFVGYDKILVLNDLTISGTHSPSWNKFSWGVETIGDYEYETFDSDTKANLVGALAILHSRIGINPDNFILGVRGLHFHKEDSRTTHKTCPGKNVIKETLIKEILSSMNNESDSHDVSLEVQELETLELTDYELIDVKWLQQNLNTKFNTGLKVDGIVGNLTKNAVRNFQKLVGLSLIDGIAGPITRKALKNYNIARIK